MISKSAEKVISNRFIICSILRVKIYTKGTFGAYAKEGQIYGETCTLFTFPPVVGRRVTAYRFEVLGEVGGVVKVEFVGYFFYCKTSVVE